MGTDKAYSRNILAFSLIHGVGAAFMKKNRLILHKYRDELDMLANFGGKINKKTLSEQLGKADEILAYCKSVEVGLLTIVDEDYPSSLLALKDPPPILFYKGNQTLLSQVLCLLGTSNSTELGHQIAKRVALYFKDQFTICNGLHGKLDQFVMENEDVQSKAIAVLDGGFKLEQTLSPYTCNLAHQILNKGGLLISEFLPGKVQDKFSTIKSRRIQAGIAKGLIMVQSPLESGTKYTLRAFSQLKRPLGFIKFVKHPEFLQHPSFAVNRLLDQKNKDGLAEWTQMDHINPGPIIAISSTAEYEEMVQQMLNFQNK